MCRAESGTPYIRDMKNHKVSPRYILMPKRGSRLPDEEATCLRGSEQRFVPSRAQLGSASVNVRGLSVPRAILKFFSISSSVLF